jgi:hypothetical protein
MGEASTGSGGSHVDNDDPRQIIGKIMFDSDDSEAR